MHHFNESEALIHSRIKEFLSTCTVTEKLKIFQILRSPLKESQDKIRLAHNCLEEDEGLNEIVHLVYEPIHIWETTGFHSLK